MKQLIVLAAVLPLLLVFMMQYTLDQKNQDAISALQQQVYTAKEQARQAGCFTEEIKSQLRSRINTTLGIPEKDIVIAATETPRYRMNTFGETVERGMIHYRVSIPLDKLMAGNRMFGIKDEDNKTVYTVEGVAASERLPAY